MHSIQIPCIRLFTDIQCLHVNTKPSATWLANAVQVGANGSVLSASISLHSRIEQVGTKDLDTHSSFAVLDGGKLVRGSCIFSELMDIVMHKF